GQMSASSNVGSTSGSGNTASTSSASGAGGMAASSSSGDMASTSASSSSSGGPATSSSSGGPTTILCGNMMCPLGNMNACCWSEFAQSGMCVQGPPQTDNCNTDPVMGGFQTRIECQVPQDCPGGICYGHLAGMQSYYNTVMCQPTCDTNAG